MLPIDAILDTLGAALDDHPSAVLVAQPGAGKTTRVPPYLLERSWCQGQRLLLLEPRRVAVRLAASFMAEQLGEVVGKRIGYRMRGESRVSAETRLEVVTPGVLLRLLQSDPLLEGIAGIVFDEFHERSLAADLALALALDVQSSVREELRLLVMSATLDTQAVHAALGEQAPILDCPGREYPVETRYRPLRERDDQTMHVASVLDEALTLPQTQSMLLIAPTIRDVNQFVEAFTPRYPELEVRPLHGGLSLDEQQVALTPSPVKTSQAQPSQVKPSKDKKRLIVATAIAESSLTVPDVNVVIDLGRERVPVFETRSGFAHLATRRVNRASADQRRGRAGRTAPGRCFRLWASEQPLVPFGEPEMLQADVSGVVLELAQWGVTAPNALRWVTPVPVSAWEKGQALLQLLGALDADGGLTPLGRRSSEWRLSPRLAIMLARADELKAMALACALAPLLESEGSEGGFSLVGLQERLLQPKRYPLWRREAARLARQAKVALPTAVDEEQLSGLLALAYPDRLAQRTEEGRFRLVNGVTARLAPSDPLAHSAWLVVVEAHRQDAAESSGEMIHGIRRAVALSQTMIERLYGAHLGWQPRVEWSDAEGRLIGREQRSLGALVVAQRPLSTLPRERISAALIEALRQRPWLLSQNEALSNLRGRLALLHLHRDEADWPDPAEAPLLASLETWLGPYLDGITRLAQLEKAPLANWFKQSLTWEQQVTLERLVPASLPVPSQADITLDYAPCLGGQPPVLALKLQEAFGWRQTPAVLDGEVAVMVHLLSPARRVLQITQDLAHFWQHGYPDVRKEMRGRYPKHPWPEDPLTALATAATKRKMARH